MSESIDIKESKNTIESKNTKDSMCKSFRIVLNLPYNDDRFSDIQTYFHFVLTTLSNANDFFYWGIVHELDKDENGDFKTPHIHIVLKSPVRKRKETIINYLSNILLVDPTTISVRFARDLLNSITYLTHLNMSDKYQYNKSDICTNDFSTLDNAYSDIRKGITIDYLVSLCKYLDFNAIEIFLELGLDYSTKYRNLIETICKYGVKYKNVK